MARRSDRQTAWDNGGLKLVGRKTLEYYNKHVRPFRPRCDAMRKNGIPCRNLALTSGKCRIHGGATPRGENWHKRQWPSGSAPDAEKKLHDKLKLIERDGARLKRRLAKMSTDERRRYDEWHQARQPGPPGPRAQRRADRKSAAEMRKSLTDDAPRHISPELAALREQAAALEAERDRLLMHQIQEEPIGVFS